ncbi:FAD-dependent oxidoreductase [Nocardia fusca]|uniref:FAD-dependent oxidoreductase n=1 Tax=Nocardia fusca TaxID=941183 RepID=UPI0007A75033|nr:FAD-dependent oxidoreductase [Nocardia fusca]
MIRNWKETSIVGTDCDLPILDTVDVLVVGGGAAGVAAATVAAEAGASVVLVEKYGFCGGAAVAGMSGTVCGMYAASDTPGSPVQIVQGFSERFSVELTERGGLTAPQMYGKTWTAAHDPLVWREAAETMLLDVGVRILFHTNVIGVIMEGASYEGVVVESTAGRSLIRARRTIDASGDGAVIARAGHRYTYGDNGRIQNPTMFFRIAGVDVDRFLDFYGHDTICSPDVSADIVAARAEGLDLPRQKIWIFQTPRPGELMVNATRLVGFDGRMLNVVDPVDFTEAEIGGRRQVRSYAEYLKLRMPGCENSYVVDTGTEVGIRQTRTIAAVQQLTNTDVLEHRKRADGIARVPWPIELHDGDKPKLHWILDDFYEVPFDALIPEAGDNIIVAGRCLGAEHEALASARVTAQCFEYGHAAGVAVCQSLEHDVPLREIRGEAVRELMAANGSDL